MIKQLRSQSSIKDPDNHLRWSFFAKYLSRNCIIDVWQGLKSASEKNQNIPVKVNLITFFENYSEELITAFYKT